MEVGTADTGGEDDEISHAIFDQWDVGGCRRDYIE
jgi:hypothetical protein